MAEPKEKMVKIRLRANGESYKYVGINDRNWKIKRGVEVEVPECVADLLKQQEEEEDRLANLIMDTEA